MILYYLIFFLLAFFAFFNLPEKQRKTILMVFCAVFVLLAGLRGAIDGDHNAYLSKYQDIIASGDASGFEISYTVISKIAGFFGSFQVLIFIYTLLSVVPFTYLVIKYWHSDILIFLLYFSFFFFLHAMTQIRIAVAINFFLLGLNYIAAKKPWKFSGSLLVGSLFHRSVLILAPLYFFLGKHLKTSLMIIIIVTAVALSVAIDGMSLIINQLGPLIGGTIETKLQMHEGTMMGGLGGRTSGVYIIMVSVKLIVNVVYRRLFTTEINENSLLRVYLNATFFGCVFYIVFSDFHIVAARVAEMFYITEIFYIPMIVGCIKQRTIGRFAVIVYAFAQLFVTIEVIGFIQPYRLGI